MNKKQTGLLIFALIYAVVLSIAASLFQEQTILHGLYIAILAASAAILIIIGIEDNNTLQVSWFNTAIYALFVLPGIFFGIRSGALLEQLIFYLPGFAYAITMIIYSFKTGRGGADRDIGIISIAAFPMTAVLALIPSLIISIAATIKRKEKYPFLFPYAITFGLLALAQLSTLIMRVMI